MSESKKFAFDVGITFIASIISMLFGFIITIFLGRILGPEDLGLYRMASTVYGIAILIAGIGIPAAMIKFVAATRDDRNKSNSIVSSGVVTSFLIGIVFSVFFYHLSGMFEGIFKMQGLSELLKLLSPVFPFTLVSGALLGLLNGRREMKKFGIAMIVQSVLMLVISVSLIYLDFGAAGAMIGVVMASIGSCLFLLWVSMGYFEFRLEGYFQTTKEIMRFGFIVLAAGAFNDINNQMDILLVGYFLMSTDLGYYSAAITLSRSFWFIPLSVQKITYPATAEYWRKNNHLILNTMIDKTMKYCTLILLLIGLGIGFFANEIIIFLFKENFIYAVLPLRILLIGTVIRGCIVQPIGGSLSGIGRPDLELKISAFMMAINVPLDIILIPQFGIIGAAIAATISLIGGALINLYLVIRKLSIKIDFRWYLNISIVVLFAIVLFRLGYNFIDIYLLGGSILLIFLILVLNLFLTEEDMITIKSIVFSTIINRR